MNIMKKDSKKNKYVVIIGCGRVGASIANSLSEKNIDVTVIDKNKEAFRKLSPLFAGLVVEGNATEINVLDKVNLNECTDLLCVTNKDNTNIMVSQIVKEVFSVKNIVSRLYDPERACVYNQFEIDTICPSILSAEKINEILEKGEYKK